MAQIDTENGDKVELDGESDVEIEGKRDSRVAV